MWLCGFVLSLFMLPLNCTWNCCKKSNLYTPSVQGKYPTMKVPGARCILDNPVRMGNSGRGVPPYHRMLSHSYSASLLPVKHCWLDPLKDACLSISLQGLPIGGSISGKCAKSTEGTTSFKRDFREHVSWNLPSGHKSTGDRERPLIFRAWTLKGSAAGMHATRSCPGNVGGGGVLLGVLLPPQASLKVDVCDSFPFQVPPQVMVERFHCPRHFCPNHVPMAACLWRGVCLWNSSPKSPDSPKGPKPNARRTRLVGL